MRNQRTVLTIALHGDILPGKGGRIIRVSRTVGELVTGRNRTTNLVDDVGNQTARKQLVSIYLRPGRAEVTAASIASVAHEGEYVPGQVSSVKLCLVFAL